MAQSLTIRVQSEDIKGALVLQKYADCKTAGDAVHAAMQLFASIPDEMLAQIQAESRAQRRSTNQEIIMLLQEALALRQSQSTWLASAEEGNG